MHLSSPLWCALVSFAHAQQSSLAPTSTSKTPAIPWITFTSTRSCTVQPSTVFVYTSDSTSFFLTHPSTRNSLSSSQGGLSSAKEDAQSTDDGVFTTAAPSHLSEISKIEAGQGTIAEDPNSSTGSTSFAQMETLVTLRSSDTDSHGGLASGTSTSRLGAGFSADSGPRSGTISLESLTDSWSSIGSTLSTRSSDIGPAASSGFVTGQCESQSIPPPLLPTPLVVVSGSTCPLPLTVTISSVSNNAHCEWMSTVTSYISNECPMPTNALPITRTITQSGPTIYSMPETQLLTVTYTTMQGGSTIFQTSVVDHITGFPDHDAHTIIERTVTVERKPQSECGSTATGPEYVTLTTLQDGTTVYRTSLIDRTTVLISSDLATATLTLVENGSTFYITSIVERTASPTPQLSPTFTYEQSQDVSGVQQTSNIERTLSLASSEPMVITQTLVEGGSTSYRMSTIWRTVENFITYTEYLGGSTLYITSTILQSPSLATITYTELAGLSTVYRTSVITNTPSPDLITYTTVEGASVIYKTVPAGQATQEPVTRTLTESGPTVYLTSFIERTQEMTPHTTPSPVFVTHKLTEGGSIIYETSLVERTVGVGSPATIFVTKTETLVTSPASWQSGSSPSQSERISSRRGADDAASDAQCPTVSSTTIYVTRTDALADQTDFPSTAYSSCPAWVEASPVTSYIYTADVDSSSCPQSGSFSTLTITEAGFTSYIVSKETECTKSILTSSTQVDEAMGSATNLEAEPTSGLSMAASTIYSCLTGSIQELPSNASLSPRTVTSIFYETLSATGCLSDLSLRTITSFVYQTDQFSSSAISSEDGTAISPTGAYSSDFAVQTVTSFIYGPTVMIESSGELIPRSSTFYDVITLTETTSIQCSLNTTGAFPVQTVTSIIYPSSCDYRYTTKFVPEITVTKRGSTITVYASSTRTITAYSVITGNATNSDPSGTPEPTSAPEDEGDPEDPGSEEEGGDESQPESGTLPPQVSQTAPVSESSAQPAPSPTPVVANATELQEQGSASHPFVVAQVVTPNENTPIAPSSNSSFLLVTFGSTNASSTTSTSSLIGQRKRQASQQQAAYNTTAYFSAVAGGIYNLSASAAVAQNGDTPPSCMLSICVESMCGPSYPLTMSFVEYTYTFNSPDTVNAQASIFSIMCAGQAYVGLDNVRVDSVSVPQSSSAIASSTARGSNSAFITVSASNGVPSSTSRASVSRATVRTVTTSILSTITTTAYATQTLTITQVSTEPASILSLSGLNVTEYYTATETTLLEIVSTAYYTGYTTILLTTLSVPPPETTYLNASTITFTPEPSTIVLTTAIPTTFNLTETIHATETQSLQITETATADQATFTLNITQTEISSYFQTFTTSLDGITQTLSLPGETVVSTEIQTTELEQSTLTLPAETQTSMEILTTTLDQPTLTLPAMTSYFYTTEIFTSVIPPSTETSTFYITLTSVLPEATTTLVTTDLQTTALPAWTETSIIEITLVSTLPQATTVIVSTLIETSIQSASTLVQTETLSFFRTYTTQLAPSTAVDTLFITQTGTETTVLIQTSFFPASTETLIMTTIQPASTEILVSTQPAITLTTVSDNYITETSLVPPETISLTTSLPAQTEVFTVTSVQPASTLFITSTLPQATATSIEVSFPPTETFTLPREMQTSILPPQTQTEISFIERTETLPASIFFITQTSVLEASTFTEVISVTTSLEAVTRVEYSTIISTLPQATETQVISITTSLPAETSVLYLTVTSELPQETLTEVISLTTSLPAGTSLVYSTIISTLPRETETQIISITTSLPAGTSVIYSTIVSTLPQETSTQVLFLTTSLPAATRTEFSTIVSTLPQQTFTRVETSIQPASTILSSYPVTLPRETQTTVLQITETSVLPASTITTSYPYTITTSLPAGTSTRVETSIKEVTLPASTIISTYSITISLTSTLPQATSTLPRETQTFPRATETLPQATSTLPQATQTLPQATSTLRETQTLPRATETLPQATSTLPRETQTLPRATETLPQATITQLTISTQPASTAIVTYTSVQGSTAYITATSTLPQQTFTQVTTQPASTAILTYTSIQGASTSFITATQTLSPQTITQTSVQPASTFITTAISTQPASTVVSTFYTTIPASTVTSVIVSTIQTTVQTTNVRTETNTIASSIFVTYTTTVQGQVQTMTITFTPSTSSAVSTTSSPSPTAAAVITTSTSSTGQTTQSASATAGSVAATSTAPMSSLPLPTTTTTTITPSPNPTITTTTTRTTTTTTTTSSSTPFIKPAIALRAPSTVVGSTTSATVDVDDNMYPFTAPWALGFYGKSGTACGININGIIGLQPVPSGSYQPNTMGSTVAKNAAACGAFPFWDDLYITKGFTHGIFYQTEGTAPNRSITFEWYTSKYQNPNYYAHFLVSFYEALPSWVTYDYLNITDSGLNATVGIQSNLTSTSFKQYSLKQTVITNGLIITFNYSSLSFYQGLAPGFQGIPGAIYW